MHRVPAWLVIHGDILQLSRGQAKVVLLQGMRWPWHTHIPPCPSTTVSSSRTHLAGS